MLFRVFKFLVFNGFSVQLTYPCYMVPIGTSHGSLFQLAIKAIKKEKLCDELLCLFFSEFMSFVSSAISHPDNFSVHSSS